MGKDIAEFSSGKAWELTANKYECMLRKTEEIAKITGTLDDKQSIRKDIEKIIKKCHNSEFQIAVVGVLKAGKSMLMNALIGMELAPVGLNSTTAALTKFRSSTEGYYVKIRFYTESEWKKLKESVESTSRGKNNIFFQKLQKESVKKAAEHWIGHTVVKENYQDIEQFKKAIARWTAANSDEHLFASEVEVGIDKDVFDMPSEVVFVDTPGLQDPVRYRSKITEKYIEKADAVLVAVRPQALTSESFGTITKVLDYAGSCTDKVYIVATQKDILTNNSDIDVITRSWAEQLHTAQRYSSVRMASRYIFSTSAYLHLSMKKALRLSETELNDPNIFSDAEYRNLSNGICGIIGGRNYCIDNLRFDTATCQKIDLDFGVSMLKKRLEADLIAKFRELKIKDLSQDFAVCREQILKTVSRDMKSAKRMKDNANGNIENLQKELQRVKEEKDAFELEKNEIMQVLADVREFTMKRFAIIAQKEG